MALSAFSKNEPGRNPHDISMNRYRWHIHHANEVNVIKKAYPYSTVVSPIFNLHLPWFLKLYPNGSREKQNRNQVFYEIFIEGITRDVSDVKVAFKLTVNGQTAEPDAKPLVFSSPRISHGEIFAPSLLSKDLMNPQAKSFQIVVEIQWIRIWNLKGDLTVDTKVDKEQCPKLLNDEMKDPMYPDLDAPIDPLLGSNNTPGIGVDGSNQMHCGCSCTERVAVLERKIESLIQKVKTLERNEQSHFQKVENQNPAFHSAVIAEEDGNEENMEWQRSVSPMVEVMENEGIGCTDHEGSRITHQ